MSSSKAYSGARLGKSLKVLLSTTQHIRGPLPCFFLMWYIRWSFRSYTSLFYSTRFRVKMCAPISSYRCVIHSFILRCTCLTNILPDWSLIVFLTTFYHFHFRLQWGHSVVESIFRNNVKRRRFRSNLANSALNSMRTHSLFKDYVMALSLRLRDTRRGFDPPVVQYGSAIRTSS